MALSVNWSTKVITIPQADLTLVTGSLYSHDTEAFRLELKDIEDSEVGIHFEDMHRHVTETTIAGITYARFIEIINGFQIEFEDGQYTVRLDGSNNNLFEEGVIVHNQVSIVPTNSAGLIRVSDLSDAALLRKVFLNRAETTLNAGPTPPAGSKTIDFYDDDQTTIIDSLLISADGDTRTNP